jgi:putative addiction module killer protein
VIEILTTRVFLDWFAGLRDRKAQRRIQARIDYLALGGLGHAKRLTSTVSELKIDYGPGYRLYFTQRGPVLVILLCGGDKRTQKADIKRAEALAAALQLEE